MASQISPGIILKERDITTATIVGSQALTAAFAAPFAKGPVDLITPINSQREFVDTFGLPNEANAEDWFVASEFLNYGGRLGVVRVLADGLATANSDGNAGFLVKNDTDWLGNAYSVTFAARTPGKWGNSAKIVVVDRGADQYVTLASVPAVLATTEGSEWTFDGGAVGKVLSWNATTKTAAIILNDPEVEVAIGDNVDDDGDLIEVTAVADWYTSTEIQVGATTVPLIAFGQRPGTSQYATDRGLKYDEVTVAVVDIDGKISGTVANVIETFTSLSKLTDGRSTENANVYFKTVINDQSSYIFNGTDVISVVAGTGEAWSVDSETLTTGDQFARCGVQIFNLSAGTDDYEYTAAEIVNAYDNFTSTEQVFVDFVLMGGSMSDENDTKTKANKIISLATARKDCIAFVSPHKGNQIGTNGPLTVKQQKENTIAFFKNFPSSSYAVFDSGYKYIYDRFNDRYRYIPCNGDVAGLCVATSATLEDWYSPAGVSRGSLRNAIKLAYTPSKSDRDELYVARINPITSLPGTGITLFGDKTALASTSAFDRINVRRLFLNIERRVERLASGVLFEQNDVLTRSSFASAVNSYLSEVQAKRGVTDFLVVCDETNNTPDVIDRNEFVAEIFIKPTRSINYITITFTAAKTGVAFSEVVGR